jgi:hypothetical protein
VAGCAGPNDESSDSTKDGDLLTSWATITFLEMTLLSTVA